MAASRGVQSTSALPLKADIDERNCRVRFVPKAEIGGLIE